MFLRHVSVDTIIIKAPITRQDSLVLTVRDTYVTRELGVGGLSDYSEDKGIF